MKALSRAADPSPRLRAICLIRVSEPGDRSGESFRSPRDQRAICQRICTEHDWEPVYWLEGLGLSGMKPLDKRQDLLQTIGLVQTGQAQVLVSAYYDRMWRKTRVGEDVLDLLEGSGCLVFAGDLGVITRKTAANRFQLRVLGAANEFVAESADEKTMDAKREAVARSVPPFPSLIAGLQRRADTGQIEHDPVVAPIVAEAFAMRANGAPVRQVRDFLRDRGVVMPSRRKRKSDPKPPPKPLDYQQTRTLLKSRMVLGELRHGTFVNLNSHRPIVDSDVFRRVQQQRVRRGRAPASDRLLARLDVLRCATCQRPLSVGGYFTGGRRVATYRCARPDKDCPEPAQINAELIEPLVVAEVMRLLENERGMASPALDVSEAAADLERAQGMLDAAVEAFDGLNAASAKQKLQALEQAVDGAMDRYDRLRAAAATTKIVTASANWDGPKGFTLEGRRALIRALLPWVKIWPGRGIERVELPPE